MCGIVGLHLTDRSLEPELGRLFVPLLTAMTRRGPDSAGVAVYAAPLSEGIERYSLRSTRATTDWDAVATALESSTPGGIEVLDVVDKGPAGVITVSGPPQVVLAGLAETATEVAVVGHGRSMEIYKDVGAPADICRRFGIDEASGYQAVGHTRMATESAVTMAHSHPFAPSSDLCLVHNGSFSNHATLRRRLEDKGIRCDTDNDSEVAARYVADRLQRGDDLKEALRWVLKEFNGFFTLVVTTRDEFAVVRDPFACKPLVVAESEGYVAVASEYHALATLPGIESARVFEPMPEEIHAWSR